MQVYHVLEASETQTKNGSFDEVSLKWTWTKKKDLGPKINKKQNIDLKNEND